jgi:DNA-binding MarR family transcriptional regulator
VSPVKKKMQAAADPREVADRLHSAAIHLLRRVRRQDVASGLGPARLSALSAVVFGGPCSLQQLAAAEQVKPPTMSRIVAALEDQRLLTRAADARDGRKILLHATAKGVALMQRGRKRRIEYLVQQLQRLSQADMRQLADATGILQNLLKDWT